MSISMWRGLAAAAVLGVAACSHVPPPAGFHEAPIERSDVPGLPRAPALVTRRLIEDGYEPRGPIAQAGAAYFVEVDTLRDGQRRCLVLHAFSGTILQSLRVGPAGWVAEIRASPGPGFPGYPPVPDGRYAPLCTPLMSAALQDPLVIPGVGPQILRMRY